MLASKPVLVLILLNIIFLTCVLSCQVKCPPKIPSKNPTCPKDTLKFGVCGDWLGLVHETIGAQPSSKCCTLLTGLADLEAALCLCTAIKANVLGITKIDVPIALNLIINSCGKKLPPGFSCT